MKRKFLILSVFLLLILTACSNGTETIPTVQATSAPTQIVPSAYPYPYPAPANPNSVATAYPGEVQPTDAAGLNPFEFAKTLAPSSDQTGLVRGKMIIPAAVGGTPGVYLGSVINDNNNTPGLSALDKATAPKAQFDSIGDFVFLDVKPGKYVVFVDYVERFLLLHNTDGTQLYVMVEAGKVVDLGELALPTN